jgi:hypothetical protein
MDLLLKRGDRSEGFCSYVLVYRCTKPREVCCAFAARDEAGALVLQTRDSGGIQNIDYSGNGSPQGVRRALRSFVRHRAYEILGLNHEATLDDWTSRTRRAG